MTRQFRLEKRGKNVYILGKIAYCESYQMKRSEYEKIQKHAE